MAQLCLQLGYYMHTQKKGDWYLQPPAPPPINTPQQTHKGSICTFSLITYCSLIVPAVARQSNVGIARQLTEPLAMHACSRPTSAPALAVVDQDPRDADVNTGTSNSFSKSIRAKHTQLGSGLARRGGDGGGGGVI